MRLTAELLDPPSGHRAGDYRSHRDTCPGDPGGPGAELLEEKLQKDRWVSERILILLNLKSVKMNFRVMSVKCLNISI